MGGDEDRLVGQMGGGPAELESGLPSFLKRSSSRAEISCQRLVGASRSTARHGRRRKGRWTPVDSSIPTPNLEIAHWLGPAPETGANGGPPKGVLWSGSARTPAFYFSFLRTTLLVAPASLGACFVCNIHLGSSWLPTVWQSGGLQLGRSVSVEREPVTTGSG